MPFTVSGTVYTDQGVTPMGAGRTVAVSVNGGAATITGTTDANGNFTTGSITATVPVLAVFLQGNTEKGAAVVLATGSSTNITGLKIYQDTLTLMRGTGIAGNVTGTNINTSDNSGDSDIAAIYSSSSNSSLTMASGKHLTVIQGSSAALPNTLTAISCSGNITLSSNTSLSNSNVFTLTGSGVLSCVSGGTFGKIVLNSPGGTYTLGSDITLGSSGTVELQAGTLDVTASNYSITAASWNNTGGTFNARAGTVTFASTGTIVSGGGSFYNVVRNGSASTTFSDTLTIANNATFTAGGFSSSNSSAVYLGGNLTNNVSGRPFNTAGNVVLNGGNQVIGGSFGTQFVNLVKTVTSAATLTFPDGLTTDVTTSLTLQGAAGQLLTLQGSGSAGWTLAVPATQTLSYLNVSRSTATGNTAAAGSTSTDGGNNVNWTFGASGRAYNMLALGVG